MDYSLLTEQQLQKRYNSLPDKLRKLLNSENTIETLRQISRSHYLDEERSLMLEQLAGLVILGFLSDEKLGLEIQENLLLNPKHSSELSQEIDRKIFSPIKADLEKVYSPVAELPFGAAPASVETTAGKQGKPEIKPEPKPEPKPTLPVQPPAELPVVSPAESFDVAQDKPFILHEETEAKPVTEKKKITFPAVGWFKKQKPKKIEAPVKVELEIFGPKVEEKKEPPIAKTETPKQKVIHYREAPTTTPFGAAPVPTPAKPPEVKPPASVETAAGKEEPKVINLESFE